MSGVLWAAAAGIGFGLFQSVNRRAGRGIDTYQATFILLFVSALVLVTISVIVEDLSLLLTAPLSALTNFGLAGIIHFFLGWTFINISQKRIGAARTGALISAAPLFATLVGVLAFEEYLNPLVLLGIFIVVIGVYIVSTSRKNAGFDQRPGNWRDLIFGLAVAICFSVSPIFIRAGLSELASPLLGVTVGIVFSMSAYGIGFFIRRNPGQRNPIPGEFLFFQLIAGILVSLSTWMRWIAVDLTPVGIVLALSRLSVPIVLLTSPLLVGRQQEQVSIRLWLGASLIVAGSLLLIFD